MIRKFLQPDGSYLISSKRRNLGYIKEFEEVKKVSWGNGRDFAGSDWVKMKVWAVMDLQGQPLKNRHPYRYVGPLESMWQAIEYLCSSWYIQENAGPVLPGKKSAQRP